MNPKNHFITRLTAVFMAMLLAAAAGVTAFAATIPFADVPESAWYYSDVKAAYESGLINGKSEDTFAPDDNLTYAEAVKLAVCMYQKHTEGKVTITPGDPWYISYVDYAKSQSIISGDYTWDKSATRAGYMGIFANALPDDALVAINDIPEGSIPDVPMSSDNAAAIYKLYRAGIVQGVDAITHAADPDSNIRRSEVAAILTRMMDAGARIRFDIESSELRITAQPESAKGFYGAQVSFSVTVEGGTRPYAYEWQLRSSAQGDWKPAESALNGKSVISLTLGDWLGNGAWFIRCIVTDASGKSVTSAAAAVALSGDGFPTAPLKIISQPKDAVAKNGEYVSFRVEVEGGTGKYKYDWQISSAYLYTLGQWMSAGNNTDTYGFYVDLKDFENGTMVRCVITDSDGSKAFSDPAKVTEGTGGVLSFYKQPESIVATAGQTVSFSVIVTGGAAPYKYFWQYMTDNDSVWQSSIPGAVSGQVFVITVNEDMINTNYRVRCVVTDEKGDTVYSDTAYINRNPTTDPTGTLKITSHPQSVVVSAGQRVSFSISATGKGTLRYVWQTSLTAAPSFWTNQQDGSSNTFSFIASAEVLGQGISVRCVVYDGSGNYIISDIATVSLLNANPSALRFVTQPVQQMAKVDTTVTFTAEATGGNGAINYQWQVGYVSGNIAVSSWANIQGATSSTYSFTASSPTGGFGYFAYRCVAQDGSGATTYSNAAPLIVYY
ncbi:MAG: S-layer homology domain-containing protein [Clostridiales bacterium]|nr:S-layer homology domain-containing protein [Clostridiales bacterium]